MKSLRSLLSFFSLLYTAITRRWWWSSLASLSTSVFHQNKMKCKKPCAWGPLHHIRRQRIPPLWMDRLVFLRTKQNKNNYFVSGETWLVCNPSFKLFFKKSENFFCFSGSPWRRCQHQVVRWWWAPSVIICRARLKFCLGLVSRK